MDITQVKKIGEEIVEALKSANRAMPNREWTAKIKRIIMEIGVKHRFDICPSELNKEWLYDLVWYCNDRNDPKYLKNIFLVCESELDTTKKQLDEIRYDFQKLLQSNAPLKVMLAQTYSKYHTADEIFEDCRKGVLMCDNLKTGDSVLVIVFDEGDDYSKTPHHWIEKK